MRPTEHRLQRTLLRPSLPALGAALLLAACATPQVTPPTPEPPPARFKEAGAWQPAATGATVPDAWWTLFQDPVLDGLQRRLVIGNQNLRAAVAQVASARAVLDASQRAGLPTLSATLSGTRSAGPAADTAARGPENNVALGASASWEIDLWGRLAQANQAAQASLQANSADLAAARLSAQALLVQTYCALRTAEAQEALLERSAQAYSRALALTQARYGAGVAPRSDVLQAQTQLQGTLAQQSDTAAQRAQLEHAIAVLLGVAPSAFMLAPTAAAPAVPEVPPLLPARLLERRPDIAAAQRRVAAAYAQIGVADAAFFPDLTLTASAGYRSGAVARLVSAPNFLWSLGPSLSQALFDNGQRRLASAQARAAAEQATASYRQTVLTALQEVEDNLVLARRLQQEAQAQQQALQAAQRNLEITLAQYRAGTVNYLSVVAAQASALGSESSLLAVRNRELAAVNQLLKNIAGRWDGEDPA